MKEWNVRKPKSNSRTVLAGAIKDLRLELKLLSQEKADLKKLADKTGEKLTKLVRTEARLNQKKSLQIKLDKISDKISKVSKIKSVMADL